MASQLSQFHSQLSSVPQAKSFDFEDEQFDIKNVYMHFLLKHERTPTSLFMDKMFADPLKKFA